MKQADEDVTASPAVKGGNKTGSDTARRHMTAQHPFFSSDPSKTPLFAVCEGLSFDNALGWASIFLDTADAITCEAATDMDSGSSPDCRRVWAASYLVEISRALVDAAIKGLREDDSRHGEFRSEASA